MGVELTSVGTLISPRQAFEDNMRPAKLLLRVFRLLECESLQSDGDLVKALREVVGASHDEELMLIYNEIFIGLVRERAQIPSSALKASALTNLLRQAVVAACTGLDTYLPSLIRAHLPTVIEVRGREFLPSDKSLQDYFKTLTFSLTDTLRLLKDPEAPLFIANKILGFMDFKYLSSTKGVHTAGALLSVEDPWIKIASQLHRDKAELESIISETAKRRNDIVHRADRPQKDPNGPVQDISYVWTRQAVDTVEHVCLTLDELVTNKMAELKAQER